MVVNSLKYFFISLFVGCASYTQQNAEMRYAFYNGDYEKSQNELEDLELQTSNTDELLYYLENGSLATRRGRSRDARRSFDIAKKLVDDSYTTSISSTTASFFINDSSQVYYPEDYEQVAIHTMAALSWLEDQNLEGARVEAKRINSRLDQLKNNDHLYHKDGFAWLLSALVFESNGDIDDAIIDYRKSLDAYETSYGRFSPSGVPDVLIESFYRLAKQKNRHKDIERLKPYSPKHIRPLHSSLVVIHERGHIDIKRSKDFFITLNNELIRFSFPYIHHPIWGSVDYHRVETANQHVEADLMVHMNALAHTSLEDRRGRLIAKGFVRLAAKSAMIQEARQAFGPIGGTIANLITTATETADTRSWSLLPQRFYMSRLWLKPGKHIVKVFSSPERYKTHHIEVGSNQILFLRDWD